MVQYTEPRPERLVTAPQTTICRPGDSGTCVDPSPSFDIQIRSLKTRSTIRKLSGSHHLHFVT
jgi:hypothetical protein